MKKTFSKIEYVDAFYISDNTLEKVDLYPHVSYGIIVNDSQDFIILSFINNVKTGESVKGLLLTKNSLVINYKKPSNVHKGFIVGDKVAVSWDDIVYFEKGAPPKEQTRMYTEGDIAMITPTFLVIKDPVTLRVSPKPLKNHPGYTPFYYVIPLSFVTTIEKLV